ncbi:MAG: NUDIX hydrolase [Candidatus Eremiobacteraeota bacterium]|nr:NUDIX hydrolase [Candidatus Eremiobacteraeota bacterium]
MKKPDWRITASSYAVDTPYLRLRKDTIELPGGVLVEDYYVRESRGFVVIFALTESGEVVLVRQYKHGIARVLLELPAGAIDEGETAEHCALRELLEETGYAAQSMKRLASFVTEPTNSNSLAHLFLARDAKKVSGQQLDVTEAIDIELVPLRELQAHVRSGAIDSMPHVASIYTVLDVLGALRIS